LTDPIPLDRLEVVETCFTLLHRSAAEVWKRRKPVRLVFGRDRLDLTAIESRKAALLEEAKQNEELAPDVVRGIVPVTRASDGSTRLAGEGPAIDWALWMRRLDDADRADRRLAAGALDDAGLRAVARRLARFHERQRRPTRSDAHAFEQALRARIALQIGAPDWPRRTPLPEEVAAIEVWQRDFVDRQGARLRARAQSDAIRQGHGELSLEHVFLDDAGEVRILAGLEAGPWLRETDVAADVALLANDLAARHRVDLAERFVAEYARLANDFDLYPLLDFHASVCAAMRAKLDWLAADREVAGSPAERRYRERARHFLALARAAPRRPLLPPIVVAMGGQVASGKSTVALHIARRIGAPVVGSDPTRDYLLGARLDEDLHEARWEEAFEPGFAARVYTEVLRRAGEVLRSGRPVVIDGCFRSSRQRLEARALAERFDLPFVFVEARVSPEIQHQRLAERAARDGVPIDDWQQIADRLRAQWEPVHELPADQHLALDTGLPLEENALEIEARLPTWPATLTG